MTYQLKAKMEQDDINDILWSMSLSNERMYEVQSQLNYVASGLATGFKHVKAGINGINLKDCQTQKTLQHLTRRIAQLENENHDLKYRVEYVAERLGPLGKNRESSGEEDSSSDSTLRKYRVDSDLESSESSKSDSPPRSLLIENGTALTKSEASDEFQPAQERRLSIDDLVDETFYHENQKPTLKTPSRNEAFNGKTYNQKNPNSRLYEPTLEAYRQSCKERDLDRFKSIGSSTDKSTDEAVLDYWKPKNGLRTSSHAPRPVSYHLSPDEAVNLIDMSTTTRARPLRNPDLFLDPPTPDYHFNDQYFKFQLENEAMKSRDKSSSHPGWPGYSMTPIPLTANSASIEGLTSDGVRDPICTARANIPRIDTGSRGYFG